ncbi:hypothetical protein PZB74_11640 [Porifericola rhodea]|uniref:hypothetical protein n=1 Tax=Porifericola rhodea TaxID=930972 RepID=UPI0026671805|nr:hypothetical protein [Porifericola rhodea]WKN29617.1 hypothetical protein PZB74_11640 [Porifericola rhodea]
MKTRIIAIVFGVMLSTAAFAQRATPEERADKMSARLTEKLELDESQSKEVKQIILSNMEASREKMQQVSSREERMEIMKESDAKMDEELKLVFSEEQYQQYQTVKAETKEREGKRRGSRRSES